MRKTLLIGAAIGALLTSGALAQAPNSPSSSSSTPPAAAAPAQPSSEKADFVASQKPDQWLATKFKGTDVLGADNQKIGDVSDILFDKSGSIQAYVIGVGGFLGMGAKEVALAPKSFDVVPGQNGAAPKLKISMTKEQLTQAQNFARYEPPRPATTGSGPAGLGGGAPRPAGGGMAPSGGNK
ncbi:MAG: PRC-barrel domain-containing protein [Rhizobiales bacterium]|nr:PRC-barrel domain-containing protein [Hyphomicrobiales bacterium]